MHIEKNTIPIKERKKKEIKERLIGCHCKSH